MSNDPTQSSLPSPPPSSPPSPSPTSLPSPPPTSNDTTTTTSPPPSSSASPSSSPPAPPSTTTPSTGASGSSSSSSSPSPPSPPTTTPSKPSHSPTPSSTTNGSTSPSDSNSSSNNVPTGLAVGVALGGVLLFLVITLFFLCRCRRGKKKRWPEGDHHVAPPKELYGGQVYGWQQNAPPPTDHAMKLPPHMSPPQACASHPPLSPSPPPVPPVFSSTGDSGSNYSGSENPLPPPSPGLILGFLKSTFTFEELMLATGGFSDANLLGQGGFGYVHRGMLPNGKEIAVKQLKSGSGQGDREFQAEVETISRVHHKHLVSLVGYCITRDKRLLVYEFVANNTLEFHLHGKGRPCLDWPTRLKIALGSAKGLAYLHEDCNPKIIHRDIKAANILLDFKFEPKVADFGLAKFASDNNTHVSTRVMGTFGYMAPEYASSGKLTEKSDVFSYGVMLLELITGKRPVDTTNSYMDDSLVDWARPLLTRAIEEGNYVTLSDPRLQQNYNNSEMMRMVACAAACVRHSARRRPRMSQVVRALEGDVSLDNLNDGMKPGHSSVYGSYGSSDYDQCQEDVKRFRKLALGSQEYPSAKHSYPTSDYGQNPSGSSGEGPATREMMARNTRRAKQGFK